MLQTNVAEASSKAWHQYLCGYVIRVTHPIDIIAGPFKEVFDEEDWNDESTLEDGPYRLSKVGTPACAALLTALIITANTGKFEQVTAEKAAWALSKEHGFKLVVINPTVSLIAQAILKRSALLGYGHSAQSTRM